MTDADRAAVREVRANLKETHALIWRLAGQGWKQPEIAARVGVTQQAVSKTLETIRRKVRKARRRHEQAMRNPQACRVAGLLAASPLN